MTFVCDGVRYDPGDLIAFETEDPYRPLIYVTLDYARVFVGVMDRWSGFSIHRADATEISGLAARYGLEDLRRALR